MELNLSTWVFCFKYQNIIQEIRLVKRGRDWEAAWSTLWEGMGACPRLWSCITSEILVCICLTLPTVWHSLTTFWSATLPISELCFSLLSPLAPPAPSPLQLVIFLSLVYSLTLALSHMLSYCRSHFTFPLSPSLALSPHFPHYTAAQPHLFSPSLFLFP